jgi:3-oxoacyl-[acyl-carrier protein] reductase
VDLGLTGKVALVTGGRRGIGAAAARALAAEGCDVAIVDRETDAQADDVRRAIEAMGRRAVLLAADVREVATAERVVADIIAQLGRLDVLVCAAGITADGMVWKLTEAKWDDVLDVNLKGCFAYTRAAAAVFKAQRSGRMVHVASINGLRGKPGQANYAASKGGIIAFTKAVARELGRYDVTVNAIAPGMIDTDMTRALPVEVLEQATRESALGRLGAPEDCANLIAFLCSARARHITGTVVTVDGGQLMA